MTSLLSGPLTDCTECGWPSTDEHVIDGKCITCRNSTTRPFTIHEISAMAADVCHKARILVGRAEALLKAVDAAVKR